MPLSYCAATVRNHDFDRYLCTLFAPDNIRDAWFTLFAFNHEIAIIPELVSEEMIGHLRFAWWRDALDKIYNREPVPNHPVAAALAQVVHTYSLPRTPFDTMLAARASDLEEAPFTDFAELESYCRNTSAALLQLCGIVANISVTPALEHLGIAWALIGMARAHLHNEAISTEELINAAGRHLDIAQAERHTALRIFAPFIDTCRFYLKRLRGGKKSRHSASGRLQLIITLWLGSLV